MSKKQIELIDMHGAKTVAKKILPYIMAVIVSLLVYFVVKGIFGALAPNLVCPMDWGNNSAHDRCINSIGGVPAVAVGLFSFIYLIPPFKYSKYVRLGAFIIALAVCVFYVFNNWSVFEPWWNGYNNKYVIH